MGSQRALLEMFFRCTNDLPINPEFIVSQKVLADAPAGAESCKCLQKLATPLAATALKCQQPPSYNARGRSAV